MDENTGGVGLGDWGGGLWSDGIDRKSWSFGSPESDQGKSLLFLLDGIVLRSSQLGADSEIGSQQRTWGERSQIATRDQIATRTICCIMSVTLSSHRKVLAMADEHLALLAADKPSEPLLDRNLVGVRHTSKTRLRRGPDTALVSPLHRYIAKAADAFTVSTAAGKPSSPLRSRHLAIGGGPSAALLHRPRATPGRIHHTETAWCAQPQPSRRGIAVGKLKSPLRSKRPPTRDIKTPPGNSTASTQRSHLSILQRFILLTTFFCSVFGLNHVGLASETLAILAFWHESVPDHRFVLCEGWLRYWAKEGRLGSRELAPADSAEDSDARNSCAPSRNAVHVVLGLTAWAMSAITEPHKSTRAQRQTCKTCALITHGIGQRRHCLGEGVC
ncbi:hypothetical protein HII31_02718, partial [Pseudocercospora fuligena]